MFLPTYCIVLDSPISCVPISTIQHHIYLSECDTIDSKYCHWRNISHLYDGCFFGLDYLLLRPGHHLIIALDIQRWPGQLSLPGFKHYFDTLMHQGSGGLYSYQDMECTRCSSASTNLCQSRVALHLTASFASTNWLGILSTAQL